MTWERLNIQNPSERYLASFLDNNSEIPKGISIDHIFKAHNKVWELLFTDKNVKEGYLYKFDDSFKRLVDQGINKRKSQSPINRQLDLNFEM